MEQPLLMRTFFATHVLSLVREITTFECNLAPDTFEDLPVTEKNQSLTRL